jgi:hypothetical protein
MRLDAPLKTKEGARRDAPKPRRREMLVERYRALGIAAVAAAAAMARRKEAKAAT